MTNEDKIMILEVRRNLLMTRNPVANANIVKKIDRIINKYKG